AQGPESDPHPDRGGISACRFQAKEPLGPVTGVRPLRKRVTGSVPQICPHSRRDFRVRTLSGQCKPEAETSAQRLPRGRLERLDRSSLIREICAEVAYEPPS